MVADNLEYEPIARQIIARYGDCAPEVLEGFVISHRQIGDKESAAMWAAVGEAVGRILGGQRLDKPAEGEGATGETAR
jgi:hypothetical protein